jgi:branched-chain amino acid transport system permease protein
MGRTLVQLFIDGISMGLVYVLMSSGFNLVMAVPNIIFIAFGEFYMLAAFIVWYVEVPAGISYFLAVPIAVIATAILGALSYVFVFRPLQFRKNQFLTNIIAGVGLMLILGQAALMLFGTEARGVPSVFSAVYDVGGVRISLEKAVVIVISVVVLLVLHLMLQKTRTGRAMRAVSFRPDVAALQGVNADRIFMVAMIIGCALAGFAGAIMAPIFGVDLGMAENGFLVMLVVMLGGVGSMPGAILGGLVFGMTLSYGQYYIGSGESQILFFVVILIILLFKPGGILGKNIEEIGHV